MAHPQQLIFFKTLKAYLPEFFVKSSVLEIGSFDVNGSIRSHFEHCEYWGIDLVEGSGVDEVVTSGHEFAPRDRAAFDVTVSTECFEHNPYYLETFLNMIRLTRRGGLVVFTCASRGRPEHGTSRTSPAASPGTSARGWSYYRNLTDKEFTSKLNLNESFSTYRFFYNPTSCDLYFVGIKFGESERASSLTARLQEAYNAIESGIDESTREGRFGRLHRLDLMFSRLLVNDRLFQTLWGASSRRVLVWVRRCFGAFTR